MAGSDEVVSFKTLQKNWAKSLDPDRLKPNYFEAIAVREQKLINGKLDKFNTNFYTLGGKQVGTMKGAAARNFYPDIEWCYS